jgi:hypothetical protein
MIGQKSPFEVLGAVEGASAEEVVAAYAMAVLRLNAEQRVAYPPDGVEMRRELDEALAACLGSYLAVPAARRMDDPSRLSPQDFARRDMGWLSARGGSGGGSGGASGSAAAAQLVRTRRSGHKHYVSTGQKAGLLVDLAMASVAAAALMFVVLFVSLAVWAFGDGPRTLSERLLGPRGQAFLRGSAPALIGLLWLAALTAGLYVLVRILRKLYLLRSR